MQEKIGSAALSAKVQGPWPTTETTKKTETTENLLFLALPKLKFDVKSYRSENADSRPRFSASSSTPDFSMKVRVIPARPRFEQCDQRRAVATQYVFQVSSFKKEMEQQWLS